jgi:hypothetical protein
LVPVWKNRRTLTLLSLCYTSAWRL